MIGALDIGFTSPGVETSSFCFFAQATSERNSETSNVQKHTSKTTKRASGGKRRAIAPSLPYEPWLLGRLKDPLEAAAYLEAVIEDGDPETLMLALRQVAQAQGGVAKIARKAKLSREATYRMLSKSGNPELRSLRALLKANGLRLAVKPIEKRTA